MHRGSRAETMQVCTPQGQLRRSCDVGGLGLRVCMCAYLKGNYIDHVTLVD